MKSKSHECSLHISSKSQQNLKWKLLKICLVSSYNDRLILGKKFKCQMHLHVKTVEPKLSSGELYNNRQDEY